MKLLIIGGHGQVGSEFANIDSPFQMIRLGHSQCNLNNPNSIRAALTTQQADLVVNCAAYTAVDRAETEKAAALAVNSNGVKHLAKACHALNLPLIHLSTDYVFDGESDTAYGEKNPCNPLGIYGLSKLLGEQQIQNHCPRHIILRVSGVFGIHGQNFVKSILRYAQQRDTLNVVADQITCLTPAKYIAQCVSTMAEKILGTGQPHKLFGIYHYCGKEAVSWHQFAEEIITIASDYIPLKVNNINAIASKDFPSPTRRPANAVLSCEKIKNNFAIQPLSWRHELIHLIEHELSQQ